MNRLTRIRCNIYRQNLRYKHSQDVAQPKINPKVPVEQCTTKYCSNSFQNIAVAISIGLAAWLFFDNPLDKRKGIQKSVDKLTIPLFPNTSPNNNSTGDMETSHIPVISDHTDNTHKPYIDQFCKLLIRGSNKYIGLNVLSMSKDVLLDNTSKQTVLSVNNNSTVSDNSTVTGDSHNEAMNIFTHEALNLINRSLSSTLSDPDFDIDKNSDSRKKLNSKVHDNIYMNPHINSNLIAKTPPYTNPVGLFVETSETIPPLVRMMQLLNINSLPEIVPILQQMKTLNPDLHPFIIVVDRQGLYKDDQWLNMIAIRKFANIILLTE